MCSECTEFAEDDFGVCRDNMLFFRKDFACFRDNFPFCRILSGKLNIFCPENAITDAGLLSQFLFPKALGRQCERQLFVFLCAFCGQTKYFFAHKGGLRTQDRCGYVIVNLRVESRVAWVGCGVAENS